MNYQKFFFSIALVCVAVSLVSCDSVNDVFKGKNATIGDTPGTRETVLAVTDAVKPDTALSAAAIALPQQVASGLWQAAGGMPSNVSGHPSLGATIAEAWSASIGEGSTGSRKVTARPVISNGRVFAMDSEGKVSALSVANGDVLWSAETKPDDYDEAAFGGGLALDGDKLYATNGFGAVTCFLASTGQVVWQKKLAQPIRNAPVVADGRVFVLPINNQTLALSAKDGAELWRHSGIAESTSLLGAAGAAVSGETVIVTYSSGEIFALRVQNGRPAWGDLLAVPTQVGALPAMADIRGLPVVDRGAVFAISYSGPLTAIALRSGERAWDLDIGSANTPLVVGNVVYVVTSGQVLVAVTLQTGRVVWSQQLQNLDDMSDPKSDPIVWSGPVLAGGRLLLVSSDGRLVEASPRNGEFEATHELNAPSFIPPTVAADTVFVVTERGKLQAFR